MGKDSADGVVEGEFGMAHIEAMILGSCGRPHKINTLVRFILGGHSLTCHNIIFCILSEPRILIGGPKCIRPIRKVGFQLLVEMDIELDIFLNFNLL